MAKQWQIKKKKYPRTGKIRLMITDNEFFEEWPVIYSTGKVGYGRPYQIPKMIKAKFERLAMRKH